MKLSKETSEVLSNFSSINTNILFRPGNKIRTVSPQKTVMGVATVQEDFPEEAPIYDLKQLLGVISLFEEPQITFGSRNLKVSNASGASVTYTYAAKETIIAAGEKEIAVPADYTFEIDASAFAGALKAASVLGLPEIAFVGKKGKAYLSAIDSRNDAAHNWEMPVGTTEDTFKTIFRRDNLTLLSRDYKVTIAKKGIAKFESKTNDVTYFVATESGSEYSDE